MDFGYEIVPLWKRPAEDLLAGDLGVAPLAMLGQLPPDLSLEDGLAAVAQRVVERLMNEAPADRAKKLLTDALLLTGLRVRRDVATKIFRGVRVMQESDTYLMIVDEGKEKQVKKDILLFGEELLGLPSESIKARLETITDLSAWTGWSAALRKPAVGRRSWIPLERDQEALLGFLRRACRSRCQSRCQEPVPEPVPGTFISFVQCSFTQTGGPRRRTPTQKCLAGRATPARLHVPARRGNSVELFSGLKVYGVEGVRNHFSFSASQGTSSIPWGIVSSDTGAWNL